jgi:hypothetical protein
MALPFVGVHWDHFLPVWILSVGSMQLLVNQDLDNKGSSSRQVSL